MDPHVAGKDLLHLRCHFGMDTLTFARLGARVTGIARSAGERHGFPVVAPSDLPSLLPETDVLINILPATEDTRHAVNAEVRLYDHLFNVPEPEKGPVR